MIILSIIEHGVSASEAAYAANLMLLQASAPARYSLP